MASEKDAQTATRDTAARGRAAVEEAARAGESATRRAADAARSIAEEGAETSRHMAEAGAGAAQRGADVARDMMSKASQVGGQTTEQINRMMGLSAEAQGEVAQQARENMDVMVQCGSVLMEGMQTIMREWMNFAQEAVARNVDGINAMMRSRSVQDFYAAQSNMVKDEMEMLLNRSVKVSELSAQTANDAVRRLNARAEGAARQSRRSA
ncbi:phasin family protein [Azospirillum sp. sgz302134]